MLPMISFWLLALIVNITSSSSIDTGLLSRLYKKAASENRPLILVLDSNLKDRDDDRDDTPQVVKNKELDLDADRDIPLSLLDLLNQKRQPLKSEHRHPLLSHKHHLINHRDSENRNKYSDLHRLKYRLEKEQQEKRERREKFRSQAQKRDDMQKDRDEPRQQDRNQDRKWDRNEGTQKNRDDKKALRSSVIRNLLRTYNDLNCEAKDECEDECGSSYSGKQKSKCVITCEIKFTCEESEKHDSCEEKDECADSGDELGSTKGERLVTVTEKCKRC